MDPLSLLLRLCASVPAPRMHTTRYCGVLAAAAKLRPKIVPQPEQPQPKPHDGDLDDRDERPPIARRTPVVVIETPCEGSPSAGMLASRSSLFS